MEQSKRDEAIKFCGGIEDIQCVFDFALTDDENVAEDTKKKKDKSDERNTEISKKKHINCIVLTNLSHCCLS